MKKKNKISSKLLCFVPFLYGLMFAIAIFLLLFVSSVSYNLKRHFLIHNIFVLIPFSAIVFIFNKYYKKDSKKEINFKKWLIIIFTVLFIFQIIQIIHVYFYTSWDVRVIQNIIDDFYKNGSVENNFYLTVYPNNLLLTSILALIKSIPFVGKYYITTLIINALLVNVSGVLTACTIKNMKNSKIALISYIIMGPLIILSPWILIPYSDTFALPFVIGILFLYSKKEKKFFDYFLIGVLSIIGYKIKPTVVIIDIAIIIIESILVLRKLNKTEVCKGLISLFFCFIGILFSCYITNLSISFLKFQPVTYAKPLTYRHYLSMGQNDQTLGVWNQQDVDDTFILGEENDMKKFKERVTSRNTIETLRFYSKKTLLNFNDGSFSWGLADGFFAKKVSEPNSFATFLRNIYYSDGCYYSLFIQFQHYLWLIVILLAPWIIKKSNNKNEYVIMLAMFGLVLFLTIFEPRTRYMYCYSSLFVVAATIGIENINDFIIKFQKNKMRTNFALNGGSNEK